VNYRGFPNWQIIIGPAQAAALAENNSTQIIQHHTAAINKAHALLFTICSRNPAW